MPDMQKVLLDYGVYIAHCQLEDFVVKCPAAKQQLLDFRYGHDKDTRGSGSISEGDREGETSSRDLGNDDAELLGWCHEKWGTFSQQQVRDLAEAIKESADNFEPTNAGSSAHTCSEASLLKFLKGMSMQEGRANTISRYASRGSGADASDDAVLQGDEEAKGTQNKNKKKKATKAKKQPDNSDALGGGAGDSMRNNHTTTRNLGQQKEQQSVQLQSTHKNGICRSVLDPQKKCNCGGRKAHCLSELARNWKVEKCWYHPHCTLDPAECPYWHKHAEEKNDFLQKARNNGGAAWCR
uniref:Uncharacterized protein n=1 Tax=Eutreptiella gymnastica TaxID=73025 RepID=A0A7S4G9Z5_9EUGL